MSLSDEEKSQLKQMARDTIEGVLFGKKDISYTIPEALKVKAGAFVTLKKKGELRGCIGYIRGILPLYETVKEVALQAAFHDPRFDSVDMGEWNKIDLEISVLTPMKKIKDIEEIEVGVHGLFIEKGLHSGLLLPQVATENKWDKITFLEYTCYKAGLPKDAWQSEDADIYIFSAEVF